MNENVIIAAVSASGALVVGLTSVGLNVFWMGRTFDQLAKSLDRIDKRLDRMDTRFDRMESDLREFFRLHSEHATEIARLKDRTDLK